MARLELHFATEQACVLAARTWPRPIRLIASSPPYNVCTVCSAATTEGEKAGEADEASMAKEQFLRRNSKQFLTVEIVKKKQTDVIGIE